jgi:hypothetical protein
LNEFIEDTIEAHTKNPSFNYGYFLLAFAMFNSESPQGLQLLPIEIRVGFNSNCTLEGTKQGGSHIIQ